MSAPAEVFTIDDLLAYYKKRGDVCSHGSPSNTVTCTTEIPHEQPIAYEVSMSFVMYGDGFHRKPEWSAWPDW